jgi:hypothetical protein
MLRKIQNLKYVKDERNILTVNAFNHPSTFPEKFEVYDTLLISLLSLSLPFTLPSILSFTLSSSYSSSSSFTPPPPTPNPLIFLLSPSFPPSLSLSLSPPPPPSLSQADAGMGLHSGHAYSLLDTGSIPDKMSPKGAEIRLIKLRNPWGYGEWEGAFSDRSEEREVYDEELMKAFSSKEHETVDVNAQDGTFFMRYHEYLLCLGCVGCGSNLCVFVLHAYKRLFLCLLIYVCVCMRIREQVCA